MINKYLNYKYKYISSIDCASINIYYSGKLQFFDTIQILIKKSNQQ